VSKNESLTKMKNVYFSNIWHIWHTQNYLSHTHSYILFNFFLMIPIKSGRNLFHLIRYSEKKWISYNIDTYVAVY